MERKYDILNVYTSLTKIIHPTAHKNKFKLKYFLNFGSKKGASRQTRTLSIVILKFRCSKCFKRWEYVVTIWKCRIESVILKGRQQNMMRVIPRTVRTVVSSYGGYLRKSCQRHHFAFWVLETNIVRSFVLEIHFSVPLSDLDGHLS